MGQCPVRIVWRPTVRDHFDWESNLEQYCDVAIICIVLGDRVDP